MKNKYFVKFRDQNNILAFFFLYQLNYLEFFYKKKNNESTSKCFGIKNDISLRLYIVIVVK